MIGIGRACLTEIASSLGFDSRRIYELKLALNEVCVNIIEYCYHWNMNYKILIEFFQHDDKLEIKVKEFSKLIDSNIHRDLAKPDEAKLNSNNHFLVNHLMDEVSFDYEAPEGVEISLIKLLGREKEGVIDNRQTIVNQS
ncbi:MAG: ATP-binding protein [bacterium]